MIQLIFSLVLNGLCMAYLCLLIGHAFYFGIPTTRHKIDFAFTCMMLLYAIFRL